MPALRVQIPQVQNLVSRAPKVHDQWVRLRAAVTVQTESVPPELAAPTTVVENLAASLDKVRSLRQDAASAAKRVQSLCIGQENENWVVVAKDAMATYGATAAEAGDAEASLSKLVASLRTLNVRPPQPQATPRPDWLALVPDANWRSLRTTRDKALHLEWTEFRHFKEHRKPPSTHVGALVAALCLLLEVRTWFGYGKNLEQWQEIEVYWTAARRGLLGDQHMLDQIANFDVARMQYVDWRKAREILKCFERKKTMNDLRAEYSCFVLFQWVKAVLAICEAVDVPTTVPSAGERQAFQDNLPATIF